MTCYEGGTVKSTAKAPYSGGSLGVGSGSGQVDPFGEDLYASEDPSSYGRHNLCSVVPLFGGARAPPVHVLNVENSLTQSAFGTGTGTGAGTGAGLVVGVGGPTGTHLAEAGQIRPAPLTLKQVSSESGSVGPGSVREKVSLRGNIALPTLSPNPNSGMKGEAEASQC